MRPVAVGILVACTVVLPLHGDDTLRLKTGNGKNVLLFPDFTWKFAEKESAAPSKLISLLPEKRTFRHPPFVGDAQSDYSLVIDRNNGRTHVRVGLKLFQVSSDFYLAASFAYRGDTPYPPETVTITVHSPSIAKKCAHNAILVFLVDGQRFILGVMQVETGAPAGRGDTLELVVSTDRFLKVIAGRRVEGMLCTSGFRLNDEQLEALRDFAARMVP